MSVIQVADEVVDLELAAVAETLSVKLADTATPDQVQTAVSEAAASLRPARITRFIPVLVEKRAREQLRHGAQTERECGQR
jgi:hypothetical protein